jgi:hypothetical protein
MAISRGAGSRGRRLVGEEQVEGLQGPVGEEHMEDLLRSTRPPRMPTNLAGRRAEQHEGSREE